MRKILSLIGCLLALTALCVALSACAGECAHEYPDTPTRQTQPTCTESGEYVYACALCGEEAEVAPREDDVVMQPTGHIKNAGTVKTALTCTTDGVVEYACVTCGAVVDSVTTKAEGHMFDDGGVVVEPTCTTEGTYAVSCTVCGETKNEQKLSALGHAYNPKDVHTDGSHHYYECAVCDVKVEEGACNYVNVAYDVTHHTIACEVCHFEKANSRATHTMDAGVLTSESTCFSNGYKTFTCADCGYTTRQTLPMVSHEYDEVNLASDGSNHWVACRFCKKVKAGTTAKHTYGTPEIKQPSATSCLPGSSTSTCTTCGYKLVEVIASTAPHTMTTTYDDKSLTRTCTSCQSTWTSIIFTHGDGSSSAGLSGNSGTGSAWGMGGVGPDVTKEGYYYYKKNDTTPEGEQAQFYFECSSINPGTPLPDEWAGGLLSLRVKQGEAYMTDWDFMFSNTGGKWGDSIDGKGVKILSTKTVGNKKVLCDSMEKTLADISIGTDWVQIDIEFTFDRSKDWINLVYYVNGVYKNKTTVSNTLKNNVFNATYFTSPPANNKYNSEDPDVQPSIYFDDIIIAIRGKE